MNTLIVPEGTQHLVVQEIGEELIVEKNASCIWVDKPTANKNIKITLKENSQLKRIIINIDPKQYREEVTYILEGKKAKLQEKRLILTNHGENYNKIFVNHIGEETESDIQIRSIQKGNSRNTIHAFLKVEQSGTNASTNLNSQTLLVEKQSYAQVLPGLEILTANVKKARHAATTSNLDEAMIFYLTSRGLTEQEAKAMIVKGMVESLFEETTEVMPQVEQWLSSIQ